MTNTVITRLSKGFLNDKLPSDKSIKYFLGKILNLENRIAEDEKLRNLSKKLVNSKSNDGQQNKREAKASETMSRLNIRKDVDHKLF